MNRTRKKDVEIRCASVSAGICEVNKGDPFEECYSKADKALYYVKQNGKGSFFFYQQMEGEKIAELWNRKRSGTGFAKALRDQRQLFRGT